MALPGLRHPTNNVIKADTLGSTTLAGLGASITGIAGIVATLLTTFPGVNVPDSLKVAGILVIGLAALAWSIATAGDALARAYVTAHVDATDGKSFLSSALKDVATSYENATFGVEATVVGTPNKKPALAAAVERLAEAHENATFGIPGKLRDEPDKKPALAEAIRAVAEAYQNASFGLISEEKGVPDQTPAIAAALRELAEAVGSDATPYEPGIVEAPKNLFVSINGDKFRVAALLFSPGNGSVQQLYFDASGSPHVTSALPVEPE